MSSLLSEPPQASDYIVPPKCRIDHELTAVRTSAMENATGPQEAAVSVVGLIGR
jgi:hypothetical protein